MPSLAFRSVSKSYAIYRSPGDRLKELLTLNRRSYHRDFWALRDVSFEVERGSTFCIVGENGSGKSTALQLAANIFPPTEGEVEINGRVSSLLELGAGFNPEFTGHENVFLNGTILGLTTAEIKRRYGDIEEFAEIGDFINQPVKTYSSGMLVRLAFAVAINVDPEILLVDEALSVGDYYFRQRCMRKVHELRRRDVTIVFVSHAIRRRQGDRHPCHVARRRKACRDRQTRRGHQQVLGSHVGEGRRLRQAARHRTAAREDHSIDRGPKSSKQFLTSTSAMGTRTLRSSASPPSIPKHVRWKCSNRTAESSSGSA